MSSGGRNHRRHTPRRPPSQPAARLLLALGGLSAGLALLLVWPRALALRPVTLVAPGPVVHTSASQPAENPVNAQSPYAVPAGQPRRILAPSIGLAAFVEPVGLDQHRAIAVPDNIHLAGWYADSALPGAAGLSVIDGHVTGHYQLAVFANLRRLVPGDRLQIEFGDYTRRSFRVTSTRQLSAAATTALLGQAPDPAKHQLVLITCGGAFDQAKQAYPDRIVVTTELES